MMEIPIAMVILSRVLKYGLNRWFNIIAGIIMTLVQIMSLFVGAPTSYYVFFSIIEISCTAFIVWYAWTWPKEAV
jgi:threonine/homoserine/homoserine lactone efflux protein